jgi:leucyl aminopeptidase (aminopeptidase T)
MPGLTPQMMLTGASQADYPEVARVSRKIARILTDGDRIRVTSFLGTDFEVSISGRIAQACAGIAEEKGQIACFPDGETPIAPVEETARGKIVFDLSMQGVGLLEKPIEILVENGRAVDIRGGKEAEALISILTTKGDSNSYCIGEVAIGTNPLAVITGNVSEDKKGAGRVHIALGENTSFGGGKPGIAGKIYSKVHLDGVIKAPTVYVDDVLVVDQGRIVVQPSD